MKKDVLFISEKFMWFYFNRQKYSLGNVCAKSNL